MEIKQINDNRKNFLDLLLLGDEQESMIDHYIDHGQMYALFDSGLRSLCVVVEVEKGVCEIKNIATYPHSQRKGYGRKLINYICSVYKDCCHTLIVGTGETAYNLSFYNACGFQLSHRIPNFFINNYDHPIVDNGIRLVDMIYLKKSLG